MRNWTKRRNVIQYKNGPYLCVCNGSLKPVEKVHIATVKGYPRKFTLDPIELDQKIYLLSTQYDMIPSINGKPTRPDEISICGEYAIAYDKNNRVTCVIKGGRFFGTAPQIIHGYNQRKLGGTRQALEDLNARERRETESKRED